MVVGYLLVGAATLLLGYPSRETGGPLVRLFWRYWVWLAALPVVLLFIAVCAAHRRLRPHRAALFDGADRRLGADPRGLPPRARGQFRSCGLVPGVLALLLLAASFGPGGAIGFSVHEPEGRARFDPLPARACWSTARSCRAATGAAENPLGREACARPRHRMVSQHPPLAWPARALVRRAIPTIPSRPARRRRRPRASCLLALGLRRRLSATLIRRGLLHPLFRRARPCFVPAKGALCHRPDRISRRPDACANSAGDRGRRRTRYREARTVDKLLAGEPRRGRRR